LILIDSHSASFGYCKLFELVMLASMWNLYMLIFKCTKNALMTSKQNLLHVDSLLLSMLINIKFVLWNDLDPHYSCAMIAQVQQTLYEKMSTMS
jgi:hypothetical protein